MKNKLVKIYSHPRSGTNYLGALLKENFYKNLDLSKVGGWGHWSNTIMFDEPVRHGALFGTHRDPGYRKARDPGIYIYRDIRAVALSVWKSDNFLNRKHKGLSFSKFLKTRLDWKDSPGTKAVPRETIVEQWYRHVLQWSSEAGRRKDLSLVRYEDLVKNPKAVLDRLAKEHGLKYCTEFEEMNSMVGPSPNAGKTLAWREHFSKKDINYIYSVVPKDCKFLWNGE